jgi:hypothetical protein
VKGKAKIIVVFLLSTSYVQNICQELTFVPYKRASKGVGKNTGIWLEVKQLISS